MRHGTLNKTQIARRDALAEQIYNQLHISKRIPWSKVGVKKRERYQNSALIVMALMDKEIREHVAYLDKLER